MCKSGAGNSGQSDIAAAIGSKEGTDKILDARGHLKEPKVSFLFGKVMSELATIVEHGGAKCTGSRHRDTANELQLAGKEREAALHSRWLKTNKQKQ